MIKHALIVGSSGIVGYPLSRYLLLDNDWKVTGVARHDYEHKPNQMDVVLCDISNKNNCDIKLDKLKDITHIFYVLWVNKNDEEENCKINRQMFQNLLSTVQKNNPNMQYVYLQTGTKHYGNWVGPEKGKPFSCKSDLSKDKLLPLEKTILN
jgi:nucleoside-diphosphate-sugar epimerase